MSYGIMRVEKRKRPAVHGIQLEATRTLNDHLSGRDFDNSDIDWSRTDSNIRIIQSQSWNKSITDKIKHAGATERKGSVVMLDALYTASPEWFESHPKEEWADFFMQCMEFHVKEYCHGESGLLISGVIHLDEKTPHLTVQSVPITEDGRLSAKDIMGNRGVFSGRQDLFYRDVSSRFGMERGEVRDVHARRKHIEKRQWQLQELERREGELSEVIDTIKDSPDLWREMQHRRSRTRARVR